MGSPEASRRWREKNPEKNRAAHRAWRERNREKVRANQRKTDARPERRTAMVERNKARYHRRVREGSEDARYYEAVLRADPCCYCGAAHEHLDHIVPVAADGEEDWTNLTSACARCNFAKGTASLLLFLINRKADA
jgi:hypothetical protein